MTGHANEPEIVYRSPSRRDCREIGILLESIGVAYRIVQQRQEHLIVVAESDSPTALAEIAAYLKENKSDPQPSERFQFHTDAIIGVCAFVATIVVVDILKTRRPLDINWFELGKTDAFAMQAGQWWRAITALTLHADAAHLIGNACVGGLFGFFAGQLLGSGLTWLSILLSGTMGNLINGLIREQPHTSIGASTAVFAALGILASYVWIRRNDLKVVHFRRWRPIVGGLILFGYFGIGGVRTDVLAHFFGLISGGLFGFALGVSHRKIEQLPHLQLACGIMSLAILMTGWTLAVT